MLLPRLISNLYPFIILSIFFTAFLIWNGGIVLGDKSNHLATLHIPQLFYFFSFTAFFGIFSISPFVLKCLRNSLHRRQFSVLTCLFIILSLLSSFWIVRKYTFEHPFLLADNRHLTFYIWVFLL